jgi:hypothetical protein
MGVFTEWQPRYAEHGIATFPVREKRPAVRGYLKVGLQASHQFAIKFPADDAFGLACRRNRITVLDVDTPDEQMLADAMSELGPTPFIVRSGSGNFQAWYRHSGEPRRVRPDPALPIDILGDGYVVAPPSRGAKGSYTIIQGSLDDLASLPAMRNASSNKRCSSTDLPTSRTNLIESGQRNGELWRACMKAVRECREPGELIRRAVEMNQTMFYEPLPDAEVLKVVASAWIKEVSGENWFGAGGRVIVDANEVDTLLQDDPDAFMLLTKLRRHHWRRPFVIANAMAEEMPGGGWRRQRLAVARRRLEQGGHIEQLRPASKQAGPALYQFKGGQ